MMLYGIFSMRGASASRGPSAAVETLVKICEHTDRQTNRQTYRHADCNTSPPTGGDVVNSN